MNYNTHFTPQAPPQAQPALFMSFIMIMIDYFNAIINNNTQ